MKFIFLIQARLGSSRYPGKTLTLINENVTLLEMVYKRVLQAKEASKDNVHVLTTDSVKDDPLVSFMENYGIAHFRGSEQNVYNRFYDFLESRKQEMDYVIRVCCDNPFLEPEFIDEMTETIKREELKPEYVTHADKNGNPSMATHFGFFTEAIKYDAFMRAKELGLSDIEKEHVTPQFYKSGRFSVKFLPMPIEIQDKPYRFTLDTENDLNMARTLITELPEKFSYRDVVAVANKHSELLATMAQAVNGDKKIGR